MLIIITASQHPNITVIVWGDGGKKYIFIAVIYNVHLSLTAILIV